MRATSLYTLPWYVRLKPASSFWYAVTAMNVVSGKSVESIVLEGPFLSPGAGRCSSSTTSRRKYLCIECNSICRDRTCTQQLTILKQHAVNEEEQLTFPAGLSLLLVIFIFLKETPCLIQKAPELGASGWRYSPERGWGSAVPTGSHLWREERSYCM